MENDINKENKEEELKSQTEISDDNGKNDIDKNDIDGDNHHSELFVFKIISAVLGLLIIVGIVVFLKYANFNGISQKELKSDYIKKSIVKFYDLPQSEQNSYVLKTKQNIASNKLQATIQNLKKQLDSANNKLNQKSSDEVLSTYKARVKKLEIELYSYKQASLENIDKIKIIKAKDDEIKLLKSRIIAFKESNKPDLLSVSADTDTNNDISSYINKKKNTATNNSSKVKIDKADKSDKIGKTNKLSSIQSYIGKKSPKDSPVKVSQNSQKRFKKVLKKNYNSNIKVEKPSKTTKDDAYNINHYTKKDNSKKSLVKRMYCKQYTAGSYEIPKVCRVRFEEFIKSSKEGSTFELIPVIDVKDFDYIAKIAKTKEFKRLSEMGLGKLRSNEIGWNIKKLLGKDVDLKYVPYNAYTDKIRRGIIIKVYN